MINPKNDYLRQIPQTLFVSSQIISNFIDAVPSTDEKEIIRYKLACIHDIVKGQILEDPGKTDLKSFDS